MAAINSLRSLKKHQNEEVTKGDGFSVAPSLLLEEEGFNTRGAFCDNYFDREDVKEHINNLANAYLHGKYVPPMIVKVRDGNVFIRDGHCRRRALLLAISLGAQIKKIQVIEHTGDDAQQTALIVTSNDGLKLNQLERAVVYGKLAKWGWSDAEIASEVGRTQEHVRQLRQLLELPMIMKKMIQDGTVSSSYAAELYREHGSAAVDILTAAKSNSAGKKLTKANVSKAPRMSKKMVAAMQASTAVLANKLDTMQETSAGYTMTFTKEEVEELIKLKESMRSFEQDKDADLSKKDEDLELVA